MAKTVLKFKAKGNVEPVLDSKGNRIPYFLRSRRTGKLFYRREFKKLRIPPIFESTNETTIGRARAEAEILLQRHKNKHQGIPDSHVYGTRRGKALRGVIDEFLEKETPKFRARTQLKHKFFLGQMREDLGHLDVGSINARTGDEWLARVRRRGIRTTYSSFADYPKYFNRLMSYSLKHEHTQRDVSVGNPLERARPKFRVYTQKELAAMYKAAPLRGKLQLLLAYECVLRKTEMLHLRLAQVNQTTGECVLESDEVKTGSKTGKGRTLLLSPRALRIYGKWIATLPAGELNVFPSLKRPGVPVDNNRGLWLRIKAKAKITGRARWHDIKHTAVSNLLLVKRVNIVAVSDFVGTSVAELQKTYLHGDAEKTRDVSLALNVRMGEE